MQQDWLGYCLTVSQYSGKLYCDTASLGVQWAVVSVTIQPLYCLGYCLTVSQYSGKLYCDTASLGVQWAVVSVTIQPLYCDIAILV